MTRMVRTARPAPSVETPVKSAEVVIVYKEEEESEGSAKTDYVGIIAKYKAKVTNRTSAIRAKCIECSGGVLSEVRECRVTACALWPYRSGEDPNNKKVLDRKARQAALTSSDAEEEE